MRAKTFSELMIILNYEKELYLFAFNQIFGGQITVVILGMQVNYEKIKLKWVKLKL